MKGFLDAAASGTFHFEKESIKWLCKHIVELYLLCMTQYFEEQRERLAHVEKINVSVSIDHGKGYSRAMLAVIIQWKEDDGEWNQQEENFALANVKCWKDGSIVL